MEMGIGDHKVVIQRLRSPLEKAFEGAKLSVKNETLITSLASDQVRRT